MKRSFIIWLAVVVCCVKTHAQADTLVAYNCSTRQIEIVLPQINLNHNYNPTSWNFGQTGGIAQLETNPPENTLPNSGFSQIVPAQSLFEITDFPIRTAVKLFEYFEGVPQDLCTGAMVGPQFVITVAHAVFDRQKKCFRDSLLIAPTYDNGLINPEFGNCISKRFYILKNFYENTMIFQNDIALIELAEPLGEKTGWLGIASNDSDETFPNQVLHQFGYPGASPYNGKILNYCYGTLDLYDELWGIGYFGKSSGGQSGSSLILSDNSSWYSVGVLHGVTDRGEPGKDITFHSPITKSKFYAFKNIIEKTTTSTILPGTKHGHGYSLSQNYPNPFSSFTTIRYYLPGSGFIKLSVYNPIGEETEILVNGFQTAGEHKITWCPKGLPGGVYYCRLQTGIPFTFPERGYTGIRKLIFLK